MRIYLAKNNATNEVIFESENKFKVFSPSDGTFDGIDLYPAGERIIENVVQEIREYCQNNILNGFWDMPGDLVEGKDFLDNYEGDIHFICEVE